MLNLDTHILLLALQGQLTGPERSVLQRHRWGISAIVLWEIAKLRQKGRITVGLDDAEMIELLDRIEVWPVTREVCQAIATLDFVTDPADELIAATSVARRVPLLTRDERIRTSKVVRFA